MLQDVRHQFDVTLGHVLGYVVQIFVFNRVEIFQIHVYPGSSKCTFVKLCIQDNIHYNSIYCSQTLCEEAR